MTGTPKPVTDTQAMTISSSVGDSSWSKGRFVRQSRFLLGARKSSASFSFCAIFSPWGTHPRSDGAVLERWRALHGVTRSHHTEDADAAIATNPPGRRGGDGYRSVKSGDSTRPVELTRGTST